jgi:hypothetical protein
MLPCGACHVSRGQDLQCKLYDVDNVKIRGAPLWYRTFEQLLNLARCWSTRRDRQLFSLFDAS